ncbi:MAG: DUF1844 domain-containing protein [Planctomycetes bacterium]|nr:DUF1844 domain-containing protein [Planctomycetota bacterium]
MSGNRAPDASFLTIVYTMAAQAMIALGEIPNPITGETKFDPRQAKWHLDSIKILRDKTRGNLDDSEEQALLNALGEVSMKYADRSASAEGSQK